MKIVEIIYYPGQGGAEEYIFNLSSELTKLGHEVYFVYSENGPLINRMRKLGFQIDRIKMRSPFDILAIFSAYRYLRKNEIDVIQTHFLRENFIFSIAGKFARTPVILTTVCRIEKKTNIQELFQRIYSRFVDKYIAVAEVAKSYLLAEGIDEKKIEVIPNSLPEISFLDHESSRKKLGLSKEDFIIGSIGRVNPEKRFDLILQIASLYAEANFVVIGDGPELGDLKRKLKESKIKNVKFLGYFERAAEYIKAFDVLLITSDIEVLPTVALEAMSAGVPVISRPLDCMEGLIEDGETGLIGEVDQIPGKINDLKNQSFYKKIISNAKEKVSNNFSLEKNVKKFIGLCKKIIASKNS